MISDKKELAEELNNTYAAVFTRVDLAKPITDIPNYRGKYPLAKVKYPEKICMKICLSSAPGLDGIWLSGIIAKSLAEIFMASINEGLVPKDWKESNIAPILKP